MRTLVWAMALCLLTETMASAGSIMVSGSGTWSDSAPTTEVSAPNATWSFSFDVQSPLANYALTPVTDGVYLLNGNSITASDPMTLATFYVAADGGGVDIALTSGTIISLYGTQLFNSSTFAMVLGTYPNYEIAPNDGTASGSGTVVVSVPATIPEPASIVSGGFGLITVLGLTLRSRLRRKAA